MIDIPNNEKRRLGASLIASILAHVLLVVFIDTVQGEKPEKQKKDQQIMDVVLLEDKTKPAQRGGEGEVKQRSLSGNNSLDEITQRETIPLGKPKPEEPASPKTPPLPPQKNSTRLIAKRGNDLDAQETKKQQRKQVIEPKDVIAPTPKLKMQNFLPSPIEMAQLSQQYQREQIKKKAMSREADIPINTKQPKFAPYAQGLVRVLEEQWRPDQKINYQEFPEDLRRAFIKLTIESNGDLAGVEILRPSPIPEINDSAIRAIHAAAPFKVLPSSWGLDRVSFYLTFEVIEDRFVFRQM